MFKPDIIEKNENLIFELYKLFHCVIRRLDENFLISITNFLIDFQNFDEEFPRNEKLFIYFIKKLNGKKHVDIIFTQLNKL